MGITDVGLVFDRLDASQNGYITTHQIIDLHHSIYPSNIPINHIDAAIRQVCGPGGHVLKDQFVDVLAEIERRQAVEEQAYWDFQALDYNGDHRINLKDALMLFQEFHGDDFSLETWHRFLECRDYPDVDVYFDEIRNWLCDIPLAGSSTPSLMKSEKTRLNELEQNNTEREYSCLKDIQKLSGADEAEDEEMEETRFHARRRLNKWNKQGVEAMLYDDGLDVEQDEVKMVKTRESVSMASIMEALNTKYALIQDKLLMVMAKYAANVEGEHSEIFQQLKHQLRRIRPQSLVGEVWSLAGSQAALPSSLTAMLGELPEVNRSRVERVERWKKSLLADGKSQRETDDIVRQDYESFTEGSGSCGNLLICLRERHKEEKSAIMERLRGQTVTTTALSAERSRLERQLCLLEEETEFYTAAVAIGLAERSPPTKCHGYDWDTVRSEELASQRLATRKGHKPARSAKTYDHDGGKGQSLLHLQLRVVAEVERKQLFEREAFIYMLQGSETNAAIMSAEKQSSNERRRHRIMLHNQHVSWRESVRLDSHTTADATGHFNKLQDATAIHWVLQQADAEKNFSHFGDEDIAAAILSDLQQKQEIEFDAKLKEIVMKTPEELSTMLRREMKARVLEFFDNIAAVVLGAVEITEAEREYVDALKDKYQALKDQIFCFALKDKFGGEWERMSVEERDREISKLRKEEKILRGEGKLKEMSAIMGPRAKALPSLLFMMGETKVYQSSETASVETNRPGINILADLGARYDAEEDNLLSWLRTPSVQTMVGSRRRLALMKIQIEKATTKREENFEVAFVSVGLLERLNKNRSKPDKEKQSRLAGKRVALRRHKLKQDESITKTYKPNPKPTGDLYDHRLAYVLEVQQMHDEERELLLTLLQDETFSDLTEAAEIMSQEERQLRLSQLSVKKEKLNLDNQDDQDEYLSILEEAAAIQFACKKINLKSSSLPFTSADDVAAAILSDLQDCQDAQLCDILLGLGNHSEEELLVLWLKESNAREVRSVKNLFDVLTAYEGVGGEKDLLQIVDDKYTVLRDKLLLESVRQRDPSTTMSSKQIQTTLLQATSYWSDNNNKGLVDLLGADFKLTESVVSLMGVDRREWAQWLMQQTGSDSVMEEKLAAGLTADQVIQQLTDRFDNEKTFIKDTLKGLYGKIMTPSDREVILSRLQREITLVTSCDQFKMAAILSGLLERQTIAKNCSLAKDAGRYDTLAGSEWMQIKSSKARKTNTNVEMVQSSDRLLLQNSVLSLLSGLHQEERQMLVKFLEQDGDVQTLARMRSEQERSDQLSALNTRRHKLKPDNEKEYTAILEEAAIIKRECRRCLLSRGSEYPSDVTNTDVGISLLADLLVQQNSDAELHLRKFSSQSVDDLMQMQSTIKFNMEHGRCENIASILFSCEDQGQVSDDKLVQAIEDKYDALKDKLLAQALINQIGETEWFNLSERERQHRLMMLKLKQKQLQQEGKHDEAAALLGQALHNQESLYKLMGDSQAEYQRKLNERLEKRKQRLDKGLSEEECDLLEQEDINKEEEEQSKKNILLELDNRLAQDKDSIMNELKLAGDEVERERLRQHTLVQLKREQRRVRQENNFDSAARMLGIAEINANKLQTQEEEERERHERLARERLEMMRKRRALSLDTTLEEDSDVCLDDKTMVETMLKIVDQRHAEERNVFIKLLDGEDTQAESLDQVSVEEIESRLTGLAELRDSWRHTDDAASEQQAAIFQEAIWLGMELKKRHLEGSGLPSSVDDQKVALLADLQQTQDRDVDKLMSEIDNKDMDFTKALYLEQIKAKKHGWHDNIADVLQLVGDRVQSVMDGSTGEITAEKEIVHALEKKYDALKDKLIIEALMKQFGEAEWQHMSELERQRRVIRMRIEERRLRQEGKMDEVAMLLGQHLQNEEDLAKLLGDSRLSQKEELKARLARRRQLKVEREAEGLPVDDVTLDDIQQKEEKPHRINILDNLQKHFDNEKAALLATLAQHDNLLEAERARQLALARLKHDRKSLQQEDKLDSAFAVFSLGQQQEVDREKSFSQEKERQRILAQEKLAARRNKKNALNEGDASKLEQQLAEELKAGNENQESTSVLQILLDNTSNHHGDEREVFLQLLQTTFDDPKRKKSHKKQSQEDLKRELTKLHSEHTKWYKQSQSSVMNKRGPSKPADIAKRRAQQFKLLAKAMSCRLEVEERQLQTDRPDLDAAHLQEELSIRLLADLQQKHTDDVRDIQTIMSQKDDEFLLKVKDVQETARREGWFNNLTSVLFSIHDNDVTTAQRRLDAEFEKEKQQLLDNARNQGDTMDVDAMLKDLEGKYANKKQNLLSDLATERQKSDDLRKQNEESGTFDLIKLVESQTEVAGKKQAGESSGTSNLLQERLDARRQARMKSAESDHGDQSRPSTKDSMTSRTSQMRREKTLASFEVTEDEKQAAAQRLLNQQKNLHLRLIEDQARQEQLLRQRIEARKGKQQHEVSELLNLGERQKTVLVKSKEDERQRQKSMLSERVARVKYERTITSRGSAPQSNAFSTLVEDGAELDEDDKMNAAAQKLEKQFKQEAQKTTTQTSNLLDDAARVEMLKERKRQKKEARAKSGEK